MRRADDNPEATRVRRRRRRRDLLLALLILSGMTTVVMLSRWMDARRPASVVARVADEELYVSPETARRMSLGFNGLVADWYWLRTLQYVGRKLDAYQGDIQLDDLSPLAINQLGPLLEQATTLDPQFMAAYEYGAVVLPTIDAEAAIRLTRKGIAANPQEWRLHNYLGYIYWQRGRFQEASAAYHEGTNVAGAPNWMRAMAAQMEVKGGSRETARALYRNMYEESQDEQVRQLALNRLAQLDSLDERERIGQLLENFRARAGRCATDWRELSVAFRQSGLHVDAAGSPLDPAGVPYVLEPARCAAQLDARSPVPQK
jgi:tetratricopeptide (TPR) repeat protein